MSCVNRVRDVCVPPAFLKIEEYLLSLPTKRLKDIFCVSYSINIKHMKTAHIYLLITTFCRVWRSLGTSDLETSHKLCSDNYKYMNDWYGWSLDACHGSVQDFIIKKFTKIHILLTERANSLRSLGQLLLW